MALDYVSVPAGSPSNFLQNELRNSTSGFPSPAEDYLDIRIDLNKELIIHPSSTFFLRAKGHSMTRSGINNGDLLIVDRSLDPIPGNIVIALLDNSFTLKRLTNKKGVPLLETDPAIETPVDLSHCNNVQIWGVVVYSIHYLNLAQRTNN